MTIETTKQQQYSELRTKAFGICDRAVKEDRPLTNAEQAELAATVEQAKSLHGEIEKQRSGVMSADELDRIISASLKGEGSGTGTRQLHPWTKALREADHLVGHGTKAGVTGGGQGTVVVGSLADPAARLGTPGGEILALITVEPWGTRGDGSGVDFLREETRALHAAVVPVGGAKPASDIGLGMVAADSWTFAHQVPGVPLQWMQDAQNLDQLIRSELSYGVALAVEEAVVNGAGPLPHTPLGIMADTSVQQVPAAGDAPESILAGLTAVTTAGYGAGAIALNPADWQAILVMKDTNERYQFGGAPFSGPQRAMWNAPVVLSNAVPAGNAIVGDIGSAVRMVERQPVQVIVGTVGDELIHNQRTFVGEARESFAVVRPQALAVVDLGGAGTLSAQTTTTRKK